MDLSIRRGDHAAAELDEALLLGLHASLTEALFPADAGRYRRTPVQIGAHEPPNAAQVPQRMRDYFGNLAERLRHLSGEGDDLLLEFLAYAEGELLTIHPFSDLNGRMSRLWLTEILRRLELPPVDVVPAGAAFRARYLAALAAADNRSWRPLMTLWKERLSQPAGLNEIELPGCNPTPLASYLKALAVLRLVVEAGDDGGGDAQATGFWRDDVFVLRTRLTAEQLVEFFLERYRPMPLVAPWGARSGFYVGNAEKSAREALLMISGTSGQRLALYRSMIQSVQSLLRQNGFDEKASDERKLDLLTLCRSSFPDELLVWLDACYVITASGRKFPPLFGTGGNEGSGSYVSGFAQQVVECVVKRRYDLALQSALFATAFPTTSSAQTPGHFFPGASGGPNASTGFEGNTRSNPWDYLLCLEGALLFSSAATRRYEFEAPRYSFPFTVAPTASGHGSYEVGEERPKRAKREVMEVWLPIWRQATALAELKTFFSEGRVTLGRKAPTDGLDFARCLMNLGVVRGVHQFQRYAFLMRNGDSFFATALGRYYVRRNPDVDLITELERGNWLGFVQGYARDDKTPNAFRSAARQLDAALFALVEQASRDALQAVLRQVGRIDAALGISVKSHGHVRSPAPRISPSPAPRLLPDWAVKADDGSSEFRIASALAGLRLRDAAGREVLHVRRHLVPVGEVKNRDGDRAWDPTSHVTVWGVGSLTGNLAALVHRRRLEAVAHGAEGELLASTAGASRRAVAEFLDRRTDDGRISELLAGLANVDLRKLQPPRDDPSATLPPAFTVLKVFFTPESVLRALRWLPEDRSVRLPAEVLARLASGDVPAAMGIVWQRLRALGVDLPGRDPPQAIGADGPRWLAALCIPLTFTETGRLLRDLPFSLPIDPTAATAADADNHADTPT